MSAKERTEMVVRHFPASFHPTPASQLKQNLQLKVAPKTPYPIPKCSASNKAECPRHAPAAVPMPAPRRPWGRKGCVWLGGINKKFRNKEAVIKGGSCVRPISRISSGFRALSYLCRRACTNTGCSPCSSTRCCWWASMAEAKTKKRGVESLLVVVVEVVVVARSRCCRWWWPSSLLACLGWGEAVWDREWGMD